MPDYINVINQKRLHIGMTIRSLARRANMDDDLLGKTLHGKRKMTASELIKLRYCRSKRARAAAPSPDFR